MYLLPPHFMTLLWLTMSGAEETRLSQPALTCKELVTTTEWNVFLFPMKTLIISKTFLFCFWTELRPLGNHVGMEPGREEESQKGTSKNSHYLHGHCPPHTSCWGKTSNIPTSAVALALPYLLKWITVHFTLVYYLLLTTICRNSIWEPWNPSQWKTHQNYEYFPRITWLNELLFSKQLWVGASFPSDHEGYRKVSAEPHSVSWYDSHHNRPWASPQMIISFQPKQPGIILMHFFLAVAKLFSLLLSLLKARGKDQDSPPRAWSCTNKSRSFTIARDNGRRMRRHRG